tara:strand:+ start:233 stop:484 length:252 start_codon:yes stop_codon:yes gene_type:complete
MTAIIWDDKSRTEHTLSDGTRITRTVGHRKKTDTEIIKYSFERDSVEGLGDMSIPTITEENNYPLWCLVHKLFLKEVQGVKDE